MYILYLQCCVDLCITYMLEVMVKHWLVYVVCISAVLVHLLQLLEVLVTPLPVCPSNHSFLLILSEYLYLVNHISRWAWNYKC